MRQIINLFRKYSILNHFKFDDLKYLQQFFKSTTFIYNEYLYQQQSLPQFIYLIQQGQFHLTKILQDHQQANLRIKIKSKNQREKRINHKQKKNIKQFDFQENSVYHNLRTKKYKQLKFGSIMSNISGQVIGQEEIILGLNKRVYNVKCMSTNNKVLLIKKQHFQRLLTLNPQIHRLLKEQTYKKQIIANNIFKNIHETKQNLDSFVKLMNINKQKQLQKIDENQENDQNIQREQQSHTNILKNLRLPRLSRRNQTQFKPKVKKTLSSINQSTALITKSIQSQKPIVKNINSVARNSKSIKVQVQQPSSQNFILTSFLEPQKSSFNIQKKKQRQNNQNIGIERLSLNMPKKQLLSEIRVKNQKDYDDTLQLKPTKSWNNKDKRQSNILFKVKSQISQNNPIKNNLNSLLIKQKFNKRSSGIIDASTMIKDKEHIISLRKENINQLQIKQQFERNHLKMWKQQLKQKQKDKSKQKSPAHSKQFMQKMLLKALKKAGYRSTVDQLLNISGNKQKTNQTQNSKFMSQHQESTKQKNIHNTQQNGRYIKNQRNFYKAKHKKYMFDPTPQIFQNNPFDQCYFGKIQ